MPDANDPSWKRELERARVLWTLARQPPDAAGDGMPEEVRRAAGNPAARFGKFVLVEELGRGGTSSVHRAWQADLRRFVALKILETRDAEAAARFTREAGLAARLVHPHIAPIHEIGEVDGRRYLAMRLIEGRSLESARLEPRRAAEAVRDAARAVQFAHDNGVIHRDLKPHNLLLDRDGRVWVTDFGMARPLAHGATVTASGAALGTPSYMSPEQARGDTKAVDGRTDVYGLGATLYHLLAGTAPFPGAEIVRVLRQVAEEEPVPPRRLNPEVPPPLENIVLKCMEKDPARRYATARDLAEDLDRFLADARPAARRPGSIRRLARLTRRHRAAAAAAGVLAAVAIFFVGREGLRAWSLSSMLRQAREREAAGAWEEAARLYAKAPGDPAAAEGLRRIERRRAGRDWAAKGRAAEEERRRIGREIEDLRLQEAALRRTVDEKKSPLEEKQRLWAAQEGLRRASEEEGRRYGEAVAAYMQALELDPGEAGVRRSLARLHLEEYERADREGDLRAASAARKMVEMLDDGTLAAGLFRGGELTLDTSPGGAEARIARFVPGDDRRLAPGPEEKPLGMCPLRSVRIERGSWLVLLRKEGYPDVRWPVLIEHGTRIEERVPLYTAEEIGEGFVYVPGGEFLSGGDPGAAYGNAEAARVRLDGFFISRAEVSCARYDAVTGRAAHPGCAGEGAVRGVSWEEAAAFCRKLSEGDPRAEYRLPAEREWEKAARGADGRAFPWGDAFDWGYLKRPEFDVSPYGAVAMASGAREWCEDWYDPDRKYKVVKGGSSALTLESFFRCASRVWFEPAKRPPDAGFRVVKVPRRR